MFYIDFYGIRSACNYCLSFLSFIPPCTLSNAIASTLFYPPQKLVLETLSIAN